MLDLLCLFYFAINKIYKQSAYSIVMKSDLF